MVLRQAEPTNSDVPLLVISCDAYADVWRPFFSIFWKRWPDCPFPVYLGSNRATFDDSRVKGLPVGADVSWASNLSAMLDQLRSEYVMLFLEDFLLMEPVDTARIQALVEVAREHRTGCLRFTRSTPVFDLPSTPIEGVAGVGAVNPAHPYRVTTQVAIWRTDVLRALLVPGFSAWDFELVGTSLSAELAEPFWEVLEPAIRYDHGVERGKWKEAGLAICREAGVEVDLAARPAFTAEEYAAHSRNFAELLDAYQARQDATALFRSGRWLRGARKLLPGLVKNPSAPGLAFLLAGLGGARALDRLERWKMKVRLKQARDRYARSSSRA